MVVDRSSTDHDAPPTGLPALLGRALSSSAASEPAVVPRPLYGWLAAVLPCLLSCLASWLWSSGSTDRAAHELRVATFEQIGISPWSNQWFGGHHIAGYGLMVQFLSDLLGTTVVSWGAAIVGSVGFWLIVRRVVGSFPLAGTPLLAVAWSSVGMSTSVWAGRTPFCVGFAAATWAVLAALRGSRTAATLLAVVAGLASPVCAVFLCVVATAWIGRERRYLLTGLALVAGSLVVLASVAVLFPERGRYPFPIGALVNVVLSTVVLLVAVRSHRRVVQAGLAYIALALLLFLVPNPVGSIVDRMGSIVAGPILVLLWRPRRELLIAIMLTVTAWQVRPFSFAFAEHHPSYDFEFSAPAIEFLQAQPGVFRVEAIPLRSHSESYYFARALPLARGWAGHVDRDRNPLFFADGLSGDEYEAWLIDNGVAFVALANAPIDTTGLTEAALVREGLPFLKTAWSNDDWIVYSVEPRPTMSSEGSEITQMDADSFTVETSAAGTYLLKVHFSPWFVVDGSGCVREGEDGWTVLEMAEPGVAVVRAGWRLAAVVDRDGTC
jgi:hypothetical protein